MKQIGLIPFSRQIGLIPFSRCVAILEGPDLARVLERSGSYRTLLELLAYASLLIAKGLNVVFVSRQLGHANPGVTMEVYSHLFARREHGELARQALEASHAALPLARQSSG